jgi:hypothetical protein
MKSLWKLLIRLLTKDKYKTAKKKAEEEQQKCNKKRKRKITFEKTI